MATLMSRPRAWARRVPMIRRAALTARFGDPRRTAPLTEWGTPRGTPVDRWYIERFLAEHRAAIHGTVLEVKADHYGSRFGADRVEVLDIDAGNSRASVVGDVCDPATLAPHRYDAALVTQTLQFVDDPLAAVRNLISTLGAGGTLLVTVPCLSRLDGSSDRWRWTPYGLHDLLTDAAPSDSTVDVSGFGNSLVARAFLFGLAAEDLSTDVLTTYDPVNPLLAAGVLSVPAGAR